MSDIEVNIAEGSLPQESQALGDDINTFAHANNKRALALVLFTVFLDVLGFGILVPVIPYLLAPYDDRAVTVGLLTMSFSVAQFLAAPVLGALSDKYGRRPVLLYSILGAAIAYTAFGFANALWVFFAARIVDGLSGGNISTAQAYIADMTRPEDRSKSFGLIGAIFGCAFILGPAIGGLLSQIHLQAPAFAAGALSFAAFGFGWFMLPETVPVARRTKRLKINFNPFGALLDFAKQRALLLIFIIMLAHSFAMNALRSNFMVYAKRHLGFDPHQVGYLYAFLGILVVAVQAGLVRRVAPKLGDKRTMLYGIISMLIGFSWMATAPGITAICLVLVFVSVGQGFVYPCLSSLASAAVSNTEQGAILGAIQSISSIAMMTAPFIAGWAFDLVGPGAPYGLSAFILVIGLGAGLLYHRGPRGT